MDFMNKKQISGLVLGIIGFFTCIFIPIESLSFPGQLTLGIFILAAVFWLTEAIPIFATSMLVILLQVLLLSESGLISNSEFEPVPTEKIQAFGNVTSNSNFFWIPEAAVFNEGDKSYIYILQNEGNVFKKVEVGTAADFPKKKVNFVIARSDLLKAGDFAATDPVSWRLNYEAPSYKDFYSSLANPIIILFLGGFALAAVIVKYNLDQAITKILLTPFGTKPAFVVLGLMFITALLSAFMSNTATTAMMIAIVAPICAHIDKADPFRKLIALSIPIGANIGGIITPIGSPPNAIALSALSDQGLTVIFSTWIMMAAPLAILMIIISWQVLLILFPPKAKVFNISYHEKINVNFHAVASGVVFVVTILLWLTEKFHGISSKIIAFIPLCLLPALQCLDKKDIRSFSWEVLWLVSGGISLGISIQNTGLAEWFLSRADYSQFDSIYLLIVLCFVTYAVANFVSHTVSATIIIPIVVALSMTFKDAAHFPMGASIITIAIVSSFSMLLPISTPPNAIAISTGMIETRDMIKVGLIIGIIGVAISVALGILYWPRFFVI